MNLLVTGATGFIGNAVVRAARQSGHEVTALVRRLDGIPTDLRHTVHWLEGSLENPPAEKIRAREIQTCLHAAWIATPGIYLESPENIALAEITPRFAATLASIGVKRFVALGTCIEYAPSDSPLTEDTSPLGPQSLYARSKVEAHRQLFIQSQEAGFTLVWGRVFYPYGPGEHPNRLTSSIIKRMLSGDTVLLRTPHSIKDFIFITDLAEAILYLLTSPAASGTYNLASGQGTAIVTIARTINQLLSRGDQFECLEPADSDPYPCLIADNQKLQMLGWREKTDLASGLGQLISTYKN